MESSVKQRVISFLKYKGINVNRFEKMCNFSTGFVYNMRVSMQPDKAMRIANTFPDINIGWLLTGEGEMIKKEKLNASENLPDGISTKELFEQIKLLNKIVFSQQETIRQMQIEKEKLLAQAEDRAGCAAASV